MISKPNRLDVLRIAVVAETGFAEMSARGDKTDAKARGDQLDKVALLLLPKPPSIQLQASKFGSSQILKRCI
jgi:hypothetical protein